VLWIIWRVNVNTSIYGYVTQYGTTHSVLCRECSFTTSGFGCNGFGKLYAAAETEINWLKDTFKWKIVGKIKYHAILEGRGNAMQSFCWSNMYVLVSEQHKNNTYHGALLLHINYCVIHHKLQVQPIAMHQLKSITIKSRNVISCSNDQNHIKLNIHTYIHT
jgi:hypothetical protein